MALLEVEIWPDLSLLMRKLENGGATISKSWEKINSINSKILDPVNLVWEENKDIFSDIQEAFNGYGL